MTDKEIVDRAKDAEKRTGFGELVHSPLSKGVNSAYGIGFIEGMVEYRNSLQKDPVSEVWHDANEEQPEEYRTVVVWNPTTMDGEVLTRCAEVYKGRIWAYIDDILKLSNVQRTTNDWKEPVSEEFEEQVKALWKEVNTGHTYSVIDSYNIFYGVCLDIADWVKEQFEKERLKHCDELTKEQAQIESDFVTQHLKENNRTPTFIDAIEYGKKLQKQQMMKDAIEAYIRRNKYTKENVLNGLDVTCDAIQKFNGGDKVKVIIIKED